MKPLPKPRDAGHRRERIEAAGLREAVVLEPLAERAIRVGVVADREAVRAEDRQERHHRGGRDRDEERQPGARGPAGPQGVEAVPLPRDGERDEEDRRHEHDEGWGREPDGGEPDAQEREDRCAQDQRARGARRVEATQQVRAEGAHDEAAGEERREGECRDQEQGAREGHELSLPGAGGTTSSGGSGLGSGRSRMNTKSSSGLERSRAGRWPRAAHAAPGPRPRRPSGSRGGPRSPCARARPPSPPARAPPPAAATPRAAGPCRSRS